MSMWALMAAPFLAWRRKVIDEPEIEPFVEVIHQPVVAPETPAVVATLERAKAIRRPARRTMATHIVAAKFVAWMQDEGATGYWLVDEIDELREVFCDRFDIEVPHHYEFRSYLAGTPGVTKGRYRLNSWEFLEVKKRTENERPVLYRIADRAVSEAFQGKVYPETTPARPRPDMGLKGSHVVRSAPGRKQGRKRKRVLTPSYSRGLEAA